jgi:molybdate transport system ATP-binding protein
VSLSVRLHHRFADMALDLEFEVPTPGVTVLFGRSGAGKSTVIAAVAGLFRPDTCRIALDGAVLADSASGIWLPPERRRLGLVFQDARLFPHLSVDANLRYGLRRAPPGPIRFDDVVELLGIGALLRRRPHTLSGGERQRVAIGRALLAQPRLLLMDEPLASLDAPRKAEILPYLTRLKTALALPVLHVTHDLDEAQRLADTMVLLRAGQVAGVGTVSEVAARADLPLAHRDDAGALLVGRVVAHLPHRDLTRLAAGGAQFLLPRLDAPVDRHAVLVEIALPEGDLLARVTPDAVARLGLTPGGEVLALVKSTSIEVLDR